MEKYASPYAISQLLLEKGLINYTQLASALAFQCRLPPGEFMPLTQILIGFEYASEELIQSLIKASHYEEEDPLLEILIAEKLVEHINLNHVLEVFHHTARAHALRKIVAEGWVTQANLDKAIAKLQMNQSLNGLSKWAKKEQEVMKQPPKREPTYINNTPLSEEEQSTLVGIQTPEDPTQVSDKELEELKSPPPSPISHAHQVRLPLGRIMIAKGYVNSDQLKDALEYQRKLPPVAHLPIGKILVKMGYVDQHELDAVLEEQSSPPKNTTGQILLKEGVLEKWQLSYALSQQYQPEHAHKQLGTILIELGYVDRKTIEETLTKLGHQSPQEEKKSPIDSDNAPSPRETRHTPLGEILLNKGYITPAQLKESLAEQGKKLKAEYKPLGDILVMMGHINEEQLKESLAEQTRPEGDEPIGEILVNQGLIEDWQLSHALCIQHENNDQQNLGQTLVSLGYSTQEAIEAAVIMHFRRRKKG